MMAPLCSASLHIANHNAIYIRDDIVEIFVEPFVQLPPSIHHGEQILALLAQIDLQSMTDDRVIRLAGAESYRLDIT
jgi:hypothetical protein